MSKDYLDKIRKRQAQQGAPPPEAKKKGPRTGPPSDNGVPKPKKAHHSTPQQRDRAKKGRLPDGSVYQKKYDAATQTWSGSLFVPAGDGENYVTFEGTAEGSFKLEDRLDTAYRDWLKGQGQTPPEGK
jgi:hypothetical protein